MSNSIRNIIFLLVFPTALLAPPYFGIANIECHFAGPAKHGPEDAWDVRPGEKFDFFGIFDGHNGPQAARFVRDTLWDNIRRNTKFPRNIPQAIWEACKLTQQQGLAYHYYDGGKRINGGSTAICAIIDKCKNPPELYLFSVGDSGAVLGREGDAWEPVTKHTFDDPTQVKRVTDAGGILMRKPNSNTVRVFGKLAMPGTFLDRQYLLGDNLNHNGRLLDKVVSNALYTICGGSKFHTNHELMECIESWMPWRSPSSLEDVIKGVNADLITHTPHMFGPIRLDDKYDTLVLGSDGLWDVMSNLKATEVARTQMSGREGSPEVASKRLAEEAKKRWGVNSDDITVITLDLNKLRQGKLSRWERIFGGGDLGDRTGYITGSASDGSAPEYLSSDTEETGGRRGGRGLRRPRELEGPPDPREGEEEEDGESALAAFLHPTVLVPVGVAAAAWALAGGSE